MSNHSDLERRLADHLSSAAGRTSGSVPPLDEVRQRGQRLRRRRNAAQVVGALAGVGAMVLAVSLVAGNLSGGGEELTVGSPDTGDRASADGNESSDSADDGTASDTTGEAADAATTGLAPVTALPAPSGWVGEEIVQASYSEHLVPWGDQIARVTTRWSELPLEPMPDEMIALFPAEVQEFFADGLPATVDAGYQMLLEQPELLAEVQRVMDEHPEVFEHLYGATSEGTLIVETTSDGRTWTPAGELEVPGGGNSWVQFAMSTGDRLVAVVQEWPDADDTLPVVLVASTTDLATWSTIETLDMADPEPLPTGFRAYRWLEQADLAPDGTLAVTVNDEISLDIESVLPPDLLARTYMGYGMSTTDEGVVLSFDVEGMGSVEVFVDEGDGIAVPTTMVDVDTGEWPEYTGGDGEEIFLTWDELGVDGQLARSLQTTASITIWGGEVGALRPMTSPPAQGWIVGVTALPNGAVVVASVDDEGRPAVWYSSDGQVWQDRRPPVRSRSWVNGVTRVDDGLVLTIDGPGGPQWWRADATASGWVESAPVELDGVERTAYIAFDPAWQAWHPGVGHVTVLRTEPTSSIDWSIEADGFRYETAFGPWPDVRLVRLGVDGAPDEVIFDLPGDVAESDGLITWDDDGITAHDPTSGEPLVSFGYDAIDAAITETAGGADPYTGLDGAEIIVLVDPDATGETWFELDRFSAVDTWPNRIALADGLVLISVDGPDTPSIRSYRLG